MNKYESVVIINSNLEEEGLNSLIKKFEDLINNNGKVEKIDNMGKRKLAYEVRKQKEAYYIVYDFEAKPEFIKELERVYRITDEILKFIVVRKED